LAGADIDRRAENSETGRRAPQLRAFRSHKALRADRDTNPLAAPIVARRAARRLAG
jgi:hypothetical protein